MVGPTTTPTRMNCSPSVRQFGKQPGRPKLEALAVESKKRFAEQKKLHEAQVRHQKEFLRSIGVPDLTPEEIMERARRRGQEGRPLAYREEAA